MAQPSATVQERPRPVTDAPAERMSITVSLDGPYLVRGGVPLTQETITLVGGHREYRTARTFPLRKTYALCRCGQTSTPPFCDGAHKDVGFHGEETASRVPFEERADIYPGPGVTLYDDNRCAFARFCHREDGDVWTLTELSGDERLKHEAVKASADCPAGRLVHIDSKTGAMHEPEFEPSIALLDDPEKGVGGPLYVRGSIPLIGADGTEYELRNRYTLCRCGEAHDKPFCDAMHVSVGFESRLDGHRAR